MDIRGLGYIGLNVADVAEWRTYAETLGAMVVPSGRDGSVHLKIDDRPYRIVVQQGDAEENIAFAGWELPDAITFERAGSALEAAGFALEHSTRDQRAERRVRGLVRTTDPAGYCVELFWGPIHDHRPFISPSGVSGFVTGDMGLGHIVLSTPDLQRSIDFYTVVMGFRISDYMRAGTTDIVFLHCNPRHHSLALASAPEAALYHFMLEASTIDDVGYALDRHETNGVPVSRGLGRHTNDRMVSFYSRSPSGFDVELGFGGLRVDDATWSVAEITKASFWGHRPPATDTA
jgi:3,4-dihydroxy-9,10-secoandrosta-1,3,5(10)-triene-9,17-dione 4,5-dioxygenase